jgi:hypothetical protein
VPACAGNDSLRGGEMAGTEWEFRNKLLAVLIVDSVSFTAKGELI